MSGKRSRDRRLRDDLRVAIEQRRLEAHYQPIVEMRSGRVASLEVLARWPHATDGSIEPSDFIPLAERTGLIGPLRRLMLDLALDDLPRWRGRLPGLRLSLNVSALGLAEPRFSEELLRSIASAGASPAEITIEITESLLVRDPELTASHVRRLRSDGVRIEIDDFGAGHSSLRQLRVAPVDALKIDRQFLESAAEPPGGTIVRTVIHLCHDLGIEAVAEGVESEETWRLLMALGCDRAQGYFVGRPTPAAEIDGWLDAWPRRARALAEPTAGERVTGPHVLVVDDEPAILEIISDILREHGYTAETASNGLEALDAVQARPPTLVLLDIGMPILSGEGFVRELRARGIDVPVIVMSAGPSAEKWARELGVEGAMPKPFRIADVIAAVDRFGGAAAVAH